LGEPLETSIKPLSTTNYVDVVKELATLINAYDLKCTDQPYGLTSVVIAIHGSVRTDEVVTFVPQFEWSHKPLKQDLTQLVAVDITIENNANLCAIAEHLHSHPYTNHLLTITMQSGIGLGMMMEGNLIKGHHGYAGEIGHMILYPNGEPCKCGNKGCFELYASERHFLEKLGNGQKMPIETFVQRLHSSGISQEVEDFLTDIAAGLNNVINFYNPEIVVINSDLLSNIPDAVDRISDKLTSTMIDYKSLVISSLGIKASVYGACALASRRFLGLSFHQDA
ncbi:ROK family protein, partial [Shouchella sp. 1P09AA]